MHDDHGRDALNLNTAAWELRMKTRWSAPHLFIYVTAFLETLGAGLGAPVLPSLLEQITGKAVAQAGLSYGR